MMASETQKISRSVESTEPVSEQTCCYAECLPLHHRDPFDRMILARSALAGCPVITTDRIFDMYVIPVQRHRKQIQPKRPLPDNSIGE